jgi:Lectin C-type domain
MNLATFRTSKEAAFFNSNAGNDIWVGINDIMEEGTFVQVDGVKTPPLSNIWYNGGPDDVGSNENCVESGYYSTFNDVNCKDVMKFACTTNEVLPSQIPDEVTTMEPSTIAPITTEAPPFDTVFTKVGSFGKYNYLKN